MTADLMDTINMPPLPGRQFWRVMPGPQESFAIAIMEPYEVPDQKGTRANRRDPFPIIPAHTAERVIELKLIEDMGKPATYVNGALIQRNASDLLHEHRAKAATAALMGDYAPGTILLDPR